MRRTKTDPVAFFYEHSGWSVRPEETNEQGHQRCAREMASAEAWGRDEGVRFEWREEANPDRSGFDHEGPVWECLAHLKGTVVASVGGVDLGETGDPWSAPYARVIEADLAGEARKAFG